MGFCLVQNPIHRTFLADFLNIAKGFFFDGGQAASDVALGGLRLGEIRGLPAIDHVLVAIEHEHEPFSDFVIGASGGHDCFAPGEF